MGGGREEGQEEEKGGYGAGAGRAENAAIRVKQRAEEQKGARRETKEKVRATKCMHWYSGAGMVPRITIRLSEYLNLQLYYGNYYKCSRGLFEAIEQINDAQD